MSKLTVNEANGDFTHVLRLSAQDIVDSSTNQTIWGQIPAGGAVDVAFAVESVALEGATDITLEVGTGTDDDTLIASFAGVKPVKFGGVISQSIPVFSTSTATFPA